MIMSGIRRGFTLVELLIVVAILAVLSGAAYVGIQRSQERVQNEKVLDDLSAISNALEQYKQDNGEYPTPPYIGEGKHNVLCFKEDATYSHGCQDWEGAAFLQSQIDNELLTKRYLQEVPTDPRTKSRYIYGLSVDGQYFQVAGNYLQDNGTYVAKVVGNVEKGYALPSLIRAFDGPNFVENDGADLPYSPDHLSITATLNKVTGNVQVEWQPAAEGDVVSAGETVTTGMSSSAVLYFSDGSVTYLDEDTELRVLPHSSVDQNDEEGIATKIRLKLFQGKIWNKVARLAYDSEFNVETTSAIAGVRGTEFGIDAQAQELIVLSGTVVAREKTPSEASASGGTDQYLEYSSDPAANDFTADQRALGDDTFKQFTIPTPGGVMPAGTAIGGTHEAEILDDFYSSTFNNNVRPRILSIDTTNTPEIVFDHMEGVQKIIAMAHDKLSVQGTWDALIIVEDPGVSLTVDASFLSGYPNSNGLLRFKFEDIDGNATGYSNPFVIVEQGLTLTEDDIYNLLAEGTQNQGQQGTFEIDGSPPSLPLKANAVLWEKNAQPCNWAVVTGGGYFSNGQQTWNGINQVGFEGINPAFNEDQKRNDVMTRFSNTGIESQTIRCTDPNDINNSNDVTFDIVYEPFNPSLVANHMYSWTADIKDKWMDADMECLNLTEGGHNNWELPARALLDPLDPNNDETDPVETMRFCGNFGADCEAMPDGVIGTWLKEDNGANAWFLTGFNSVMSEINKQQNNQYGYRCWRM